jgi:release factor glutamine methyltransferase
LGIENDTYLSGEDSRLLRRAAGYFSGDACLEIGMGYGSNLLEMQESFDELTGTDIWKTDGFTLVRDANLVVSDLGSCFRSECFDLILFNPPYIPSEEVIDLSVDGGRAGFEVTKRFLKEAVRLVSSVGKILLVFSSLNPVGELESMCKVQNLSIEIVESESIFFEQLFVFQISKINRILEDQEPIAPLW